MKVDGPSRRHRNEKAKVAKAITPAVLLYLASGLLLLLRQRIGTVLLHMRTLLELLSAWSGPRFDRTGGIA